jgi:branched-chain amino acid transport system substrate-binding protein
MLRTGILLPRSTLFPSLGLDLLNGIKEYLKQQNIYDKLVLITDNIGFGTNEQEIYSKAEKMLLQEEADIVILCADTRITELLQPLFTASNKILMAINLGADFPDSWQPAPTTITHSLNFCMHAGLTGKLAALETNKKAANVLSYYDAGYRQCFCMLNGHQVNGGIPSYNHITNIKLSEFTLEPLTNLLEQQPDVQTLLCLFAGDQAERFLQEILPLQKRFDLALYVSPMMIAFITETLPAENTDAAKVKGYIPWHPSLNNAANRLFKETFAAAGRNTVNYFSLLGWDTGLLLAAIIHQNALGNMNAAAIVKSLTGIVYDSPRGWIKIDPATHQGYGPAYLAYNDNNHQVVAGHEIAGIDDVWNTFSKIKLAAGESSSWRNTYLCI